MSDPVKVPSTPRNKAGRPKGSKTRPKWLREAPKRPRGRPPGSKNQPKTLEAFLAQSFDPPRHSILKPPPKDPEKVRLGKLSRANFTSEQARKATAARKYTPGERSGIPQRSTIWDHQQDQAHARRDVKRIMKLMADEGTLPEDPIAREALQAVLQLMREQGSKDFKLKAASKLLEYRLSKPAAKSDVTVRSAEDWLAELAAKEPNEPSPPA